jgi:hypothetical protein
MSPTYRWVGQHTSAWLAGANPLINTPKPSEAQLPRVNHPFTLPWRTGVGLFVSARLGHVSQTCRPSGWVPGGCTYRRGRQCTQVRVQRTVCISADIAFALLAHSGKRRRGAEGVARGVHRRLVRAGGEAWGYHAHSHRVTPPQMTHPFCFAIVLTLAPAKSSSGSSWASARAL